MEKPSKSGADTFPAESSEDNGHKKSADLSDSFSKHLFTDQRILGRKNGLLRLTKNTKFIQGIATGDLPIHDYAANMLQNFAFLSNAIKATKQAAGIMELRGELEYALIYRSQARLYEHKLYKTMSRELRTKSTDNVVLNPVVEEYVFFVKYVSDHHPKYLAIALLPRTMLWRWIADGLFNAARTRDNLYFGWIEENKSKEQDEQSALEKFVDKKFSNDDEYLKVAGIFCRAMMYEVNFFREGGRESRRGFPAFCKVM